MNTGTTKKTAVHFTDNTLLRPTNPISVNLIGAGGTGSLVLTALARINYALTALEHPGLSVILWDDDKVKTANLGRQLFAASELGLHKSVALINRTNRFFRTDWKAEQHRFEVNNQGKIPAQSAAAIVISCVDEVQARFGIADILKQMDNSRYYLNRPRYLLDFGNSQYTGQVMLSTVGDIRQPHSEKYHVVGNLPMITDEYATLLLQSEQEDNTPSCSLAEALDRQDLFINSTLAQMGCSLLWNLFRNGLTEYRGFFLNLSTFRSQPVTIEPSD